MLSASQERQLAEGIECHFSDNENDETEKENVSMAAKREFKPLDSGIEGEEGKMDSFGSRKVYQDRMTDFFQYARNDNQERSLEIKLLKYLIDYETPRVFQFPIKEMHIFTRKHILRNC
jgi:hypothetical protein